MKLVASEKDHYLALLLESKSQSIIFPHGIIGSLLLFNPVIVYLRI